jgi:hypothetical protein
MNFDNIPNVLRLHPVTRAGQLRHSRTHTAAIERWRDRSRVHYHVTLRGVAVESFENVTVAVHANARMLASLLPSGSVMSGMVSGTVENGKIIMVWCVRALPGLTLPAWAGFTIERQADED